MLPYNSLTIIVSLVLRLIRWDRLGSWTMDLGLTMVADGPRKTTGLVGILLFTLWVRLVQPPVIVTTPAGSMGVSRLILLTRRLMLAILTLVILGNGALVTLWTRLLLMTLQVMLRLKWQCVTSI